VVLLVWIALLPGLGSAHVTRFVDVAPGVQLEVLDWGGSGPPILLLAGSGNTAHVFDEFAPKLMGFGHVYGITRRGFGSSSWPASGYDNQRLADDVLGVLDALKLSSPLLVGHSAAGSEMTTLAREHPDRIGGLVYLDALADPKDFPASDPHYLELARKLPRAGMPPPLTREEKKSFTGFAEWQQRAMHFKFPIDELYATHVTNGDGTRGAERAASLAFRAMGDGDVKRNYSGIHCPVLAVFPEARDHRDGEDVQERAAMDAFDAATQIFIERWKSNLKRAVPQAQFARAGVEHYVFLTRPELVASLIRKFVQLHQ
jgi:non-heme chloroperoxidase